ncbi:hypothetical protein VOM14_28500 [Paraburkholderia sp. MPAMCS5]|uniref:hypothetical protein n=1 Tax=Paraburkholderia sp. MPAMCS5 TaxID=3112563 RepID=UPI002E18AD6B|nr:hypothetical protein [Paraburkholderia sp. MPAMCS5]
MCAPTTTQGEKACKYIGDHVKSRTVVQTMSHLASGEDQNRCSAHAVLTPRPHGEII